MPFPLPHTLPGPYPTTTSPEGGADGTLHEVTDHAAAALALLIAQYQESPHLQSLVAGYVHQVQRAETGLVQVYERGLSIDSAEGVQLDLIGRIVREARDGRSDADYRRGLRVRVLINRSQGRIEELIRIVRLFEDMDAEPAARVRIRQIQPMRITVFVDGTRTNPSAQIHKRLRQAKMGGVSLNTITLPRTPALAFRLAHAPAPAGEPGLDWAIGGPLAGAGDLSHVLG